MRRCDDPVAARAPRWSRARAPAAYVAAFFVFLFLPLVVVAVFAFNDAQLSGAAVARLHARLVRRRRQAGAPGSSPTAPLLKSIWHERVGRGAGSRCCRCRSAPRTRSCSSARDFRGKSALSLLMLAPLVIPGVILGISILAFASRLAQFADDTFGPRARFPAARAAAGGARPVLVHRLDRDADDRGAAEALRRRRSRKPPTTSARRAPPCCGPSRCPTSSRR